MAKATIRFEVISSEGILRRWEGELPACTYDNPKPPIDARNMNGTMDTLPYVQTAKPNMDWEDFFETLEHLVRMIRQNGIR